MQLQLGTKTGYEMVPQPYPRNFFAFKMMGIETPGQGCQDTPKILEYCHVNHDEMPSFCLNNDFRLINNKYGCQLLEITSENAISLCHMTKYSMILRGFWHPSLSMPASPSWTWRRPWCGDGWFPTLFLTITYVKFVYRTTPIILQ